MGCGGAAPSSFPLIERAWLNPHGAMAERQIKSIAIHSLFSIWLFEGLIQSVLLVPHITRSPTAGRRPRELGDNDQRRCGRGSGSEVTVKLPRSTRSDSEALGGPLLLSRRADSHAKILDEAELLLR